MASMHFNSDTMRMTFINLGDQLVLADLLERKQPASAEDLRCAEQVLDLLELNGFTARTDDGLYQLTDLGRTLGEDIPECMRPGFQHSNWML
jgi:hypothetical protein